MFYSYIIKTIITTLIIASSVISSVNVNAQDRGTFLGNLSNEVVGIFGRTITGSYAPFNHQTNQIVKLSDSNPFGSSCFDYIYDKKSQKRIVYLTQTNKKVVIEKCNTIFNKSLEPVSVQISNCHNQKLDQDNFDDCEETNSYSYDYKNLRKAQIKAKPVEKIKTRLENKNSLNKASNCVYYILKNKSTTKTCYPVLARTSKMMLLKTNGDLSENDERYIPIYKGESQYDRIWVANNRTSTKQK